VRLPKFLQKPLGWCARRKWYILGAVGLVLVGMLGAVVSESRSNKAAETPPPRVATTQDSAQDPAFVPPGTKDATQQPPTDTTNASDNTKQDASSEVNTPPPASAAPAVPTPNPACLADPPKNFGFAPFNDPTIKVGATLSTAIATVDSSSVIWTPVDSSDGLVTITPDPSTSMTGVYVKFSIAVSASAAPGTYTVAWHIEDGARKICQGRDITVTVEAN